METIHYKRNRLKGPKITRKLPIREKANKRAYTRKLNWEEKTLGQHLEYAPGGKKAQRELPERAQNDQKIAIPENTDKSKSAYTRKI